MSGTYTVVAFERSKLETGSSEGEQEAMERESLSESDPTFTHYTGTPLDFCENN